MQRVLGFLLLAVVAVVVIAQSIIPQELDFALTRVEQAIRTASPNSIEDLILSGITIRLEHKLYENISSIKAMEVLKVFFATKDSINFRIKTQGSGRINTQSSGRMIYSDAGNRDTLNVDVWFSTRSSEVKLYAINISNQPLVGIF